MCGRLRALASVVAMLAGAVAASAEAPSHALTVLEDGTPAAVRAAAATEVRLVVRNDGTVTWRADAPFRLAYHLYDDFGRVAEWDGERTGLPHDVPPGATVEVTARLRTTVPAGVYTIQWDLVEEMVCWAAEHDPTPEPRRKLVVLPREADRDFEIVRHSTPRIAVAGRHFEVPLVVRNTGARGWPADGSIRVVAHWRRPDGSIVVWEGVRTRVTSAVPPGGTVEIEARLEVPRGLGRWNLEWDMVDEGVCWFSRASPGPLREMSVAVLPEPADLRVLAFLTTIIACLAVTVASARRPPAWLTGALSVADLVWLTAALAVAQRAVLTEAGSSPDPGSAWRAGSAVAVLVLPLTLIPRRIRPWLAWGAACLVTLLLVADVLYLRYFGDLLSVAAVAGAGQTGQVLDSVAALLASSDLWFVAHLLPAALLAAAVARLARSGSRRPTALAAAVLAAAALPGLAAALGSIASGYGFGAQVFSSIASARHLGVLGYHLGDTFRDLERRFRAGRLTADELEAVTAWFSATASSRAGVGSRFGAARGADLVMVQIESMQSWAVGLEVDGQPVTPWLDAHRQEWISVPRLFDQTAQGRSSDAELATQTSLLPPDAGAASFLYPRNRYDGIAGVLAERGYATVSAVAFEGGFWNRRVTHRSFGFARSLFAEDFAPGEKIGWGLNDIDFLAQMAEYLTRFERPFCAYLITLSLHHPFASFPAHRRELDLGGLDGTPLGNYLQMMRLLDRAIGAFVDTLDARGIGEHAVLVLWGDHDAGFGWDHEVGRVAGIGPSPADWWRSDAVPLMIRVPGVPGAVLDLPAGHVDVAPTVLALLGVDPAPYAFVGRNLLGEPGAGPVVGSRGVWQDGGLLFVPRGRRVEDGECWAITTGERVPESECAAGERAVDLESQVSRAVLDHDLQRRLRAGQPGSAR